MTNYSATDVEVSRRETLFRGFYRIDKLWLRHRRFAGDWGPEISRELFVRPSAVGLVAYDPGHDEVLLIEQFRVGALDAAHPWQIEVIAGLIDAGESLESVARREAREEAGIDVDRLERICAFHPSAGGSDEYYTLFAACVDLSQAGGIHGLAAEGEDIRVSVMKLGQALQLISSGRIDNAPAIIALQWLALNRDRLRAKWST